MTGFKKSSYKMYPALVGGIIALGLSSCTGMAPNSNNTANIQTQKHVKVVEVDRIGDALVAAADESSDALNRLSWTQQARTPPQEVNPKFIPIVMQQEILFTWHGDIEPALRALTNEIDYDFETAGRKGAVPVIVHLSGNKPRSIYAILRDIGTQAGRSATVAINPDKEVKRVELRYEGL